MLDAKALATATADIVKAHTAPLLKRIELLEARPLPEKGERGEPGESIKGETGVDVAGALIDRSGVLVLTLSDGTTRDLGVVVGKDAEPVDVAALEKRIDDKIAALPKPKDGEPGKDGFSLDDFDCQPVDERTIALKFQRGDTLHTFELEFPVIIDRGVFKEGEAYVRGDAVTWGGSLWIAQKSTSAKPDTAESGWRLSVKKGRDGKDAK